MELDDWRVAVDAAIGTIAARGIWLAIVKGIIEPVAAFWGRTGYQQLDKALNDSLPNLPKQ